MNEKKKLTKGPVVSIILFLGLMAVLFFTGTVSIGSGLRIGWVENKGINTWSASYVSFSGVRTRGLNTTGTSDVLHVSVETKGGSIALEITDAAGNVVYSGSDLPTSSFDITVSGKVTAAVTAKGHRGGFQISW